MLREVTLKSALQSFIDGEDVRVILPMEDFEDRLVPIGKLFNDARFLVDKKAAKTNPEFEAAVQDMVAQSPPQQADAAETAAETTKTAVGKQRKPLDMGKVVALRNAGWSMKKIADEMGVSEGTIWNNLKKLEEKSDGDNEE